MADNTAILDGAGASKTFASDDISSVFYPRVKQTWGPDGTANDVDVATGKPLPAQIRSATGLIPLGEPTDAKSTATDTTSVSIVSLLKQISASIQSGYVSEYESVAASQTAQVLGATGATGDYLSHLIVTPTSTSPIGGVTILDNAISINVFAGGATSLSNLAPFVVPIGMTSVSGAWKVTTGTLLSVIAVGNFT